jgi:uncharacterized membrane protein (DUF485 family)
MEGGQRSRTAPPAPSARPADREGRFVRDAEADAERRVAAIARSPEFAELAARRRRFTLLAGGLFLALFATFLILTGYAHHFMGRRIYEGLTVGYAFAVGVIVAVWIVAWVSIRYSDDVLDPLAERAREAGGQPR